MYVSPRGLEEGATLTELTESGAAEMKPHINKLQSASPEKGRHMSDNFVVTTRVNVKTVAVIAGRPPSID